MLCTDCKCLDPEYNSTIEGPTCVSLGGSPHKIGNGVCQDYNNIAACYYDGGNLLFIDIFLIHSLPSNDIKQLNLGDCCLDDRCYQDDYFYSEEAEECCTVCECIDPTICKNEFGDETCQVWAKNHCTGRYEGWMKHNCFKACNYCKKPQAK